MHNAHEASVAGYLLIVRHYSDDKHHFTITTPDRRLVYQEGYPAYDTDDDARAASVEFLGSQFGIKAQAEPLGWFPTSVEPPNIHSEESI